MGDEMLPFHEELSVHVADSTYSAVYFLGQTEQHKNLVNGVRSRSNREFYRPPPPVEGKRRPGRPTWYGERFSLKDSATWGEPDAVEETTLTTRKGHPYRVRLEGWPNLLMRGKKDLPMHQKPFTLIRVRILDDQDHPLFKHTLWLIVMGQRRKELSLVEAWEAYGQRFDVEHYFRFGKQRLLMAAFQTPDVGHEENWLAFVSLAYVQLWLARRVAEALPRPWEQYLPQPEGGIASPSAVQRDLPNSSGDWHPCSAAQTPREFPRSGQGDATGTPQAPSGRQKGPKGPEKDLQLDVILLVNVQICSLSTGIIVPVTCAYFKVRCEHVVQKKPIRRERMGSRNKTSVPRALHPPQPCLGLWKSTGAFGLEMSDIIPSLPAFRKVVMCTICHPLWCIGGGAAPGRRAQATHSVSRRRTISWPSSRS
jgi:hypothetical protein